jgi:molecular chaperone Hsp33
MHMTIKNRQRLSAEARAIICDTREAAAAAALIHGASKTCAAALGRGLSAGALLKSAFIKDATAFAKPLRLTLTLNGGGPAGKLIVVAGEDVLKATLDNPTAELPLKNGKLDVGSAIGSDGRVTVVRDLGLKEPYVGQTEMLSGEIAEDVAMYCTASEQIPTLCALGVRVADTEDGKAYGVVSSGGVLVQTLPDCSEETLRNLEARAELLASISELLLDYSREGEECLPKLARGLFGGFDVEIMEQKRLEYRCDCSRERMEKALITLGRDELNDIISSQHGAQLVCHFCENRYDFTEPELRGLIRM